METITIQKYKPKLSVLETEKAIKLVKFTFEEKLAEALELQRVSAPRFLKVGTGLQDDLAGTQVPVGFQTKFSEVPIEMVHSLAKWKRKSLKTYGFEYPKGLYTDMDAIRKDEDVDDIHSIYVDQWDWEKIIKNEERTIDFLKSTVKKIYSAIRETEIKVTELFPEFETQLPEQITFVHTEDLEKEFPKLTSKEREHKIAKKYKSVFLIGIGHELASGKPHDLRAFDYDDWSTKTSVAHRGLDGDIIVWDERRQTSLELSSMGIRVDKDSLKLQAKIAGLEDKLEQNFHRALLEEKLPLSIGGGIGQSRMCMFLLQKTHIGEVQSSIWSKEETERCERAGVPLL